MAGPRERAEAQAHAPVALDPEHAPAPRVPPIPQVDGEQQLGVLPVQQGREREAVLAAGDAGVQGDLVVGEVLAGDVEHGGRLSLEQEGRDHQQVEPHGVALAVGGEDPIADPAGLGRAELGLHGGPELVGATQEGPDSREVLEPDLVQPPASIRHSGEVGRGWFDLVGGGLSHGGLPYEDRAQLNICSVRARF